MLSKLFYFQRKLKCKLIVNLFIDLSKLVAELFFCNFRIKPKVPPTNKRFLQRTLMSTKVNLKAMSQKKEHFTHHKPQVNSDCNEHMGSKQQLHESSRNEIRKGYTSSNNKPKSISDESSRSSRHVAKKEHEDLKGTSKDKLYKAVKSHSRSFKSSKRRHNKGHKCRSEEGELRNVNKSRKRLTNSPSQNPEYKCKRHR